MTLITYCIVSKKYTLNTYFLFSLKKHTLFLDFCCFWHPKHGPRGTCLSVKNDPFSVFLYSSMISTFEYKWPPPGYSPNNCPILLGRQSNLPIGWVDKAIKINYFAQGHRQVGHCTVPLDLRSGAQSHGLVIRRPALFHRGLDLLV